MNLFTTDNWLIRFLNLVFDIVILHLLWLLCSIPIFTIGASTTALHYCFMKRARRDEGYIWQNFFRSFKSNFKQSTILWLILLAVGAVLYLDIRIGMAALGGIGKAMVFCCSLLLIPYALVCLYIFPVQAKFDNSIGLNLKNALLMAIANFGYTILIALIVLTFVMLLLSSGFFIGLFLACGMGLYGYLTSNIFVYVFRKYLPDEFKEDAEASGMDKLDF